MSSFKAWLHDTTLRDGEQMPGVVFGFNEKITLAEMIMEFGAHLIDIMPVVSDTEFMVTKELTEMFGNRVSATCRIKKSDVDTAIDAGASRVTLFAPLSDLHIEQKLRSSRGENLERTSGMIDYARSHGLGVDFAGEDTSRSDYGYLMEFIKNIQSRIQVFFIADTVGCLTPNSTRNLVSYLKRNCKCGIGVHMHNDFGLATANTVEGVLAGADVFSGTFTGIGERAGNAPTEEVVLALECLHRRGNNFRLGMLKEICGLVQDYSGVAAQRHKPVIGENAFAHESGIHVDGVVKNPETYEAFRPELVGQERKMALGKHSGRKAVEYFLRKTLHGKAQGAENAGTILEHIKRESENPGPAISSRNPVAFSFPGKERIGVSQ
jgi:isopropylmalate/homocitrate/citramalate synthase